MINMPHIIETALLLLIAFLIGCAIGYVLRCHIFPARRQDEDQSSSVPLANVSKPKSAPDGDGRPETLDAPRSGTKDDLKRIKGIGPQIEGTLNKLGVFHFDQIAKWNRKSVNWVDEYLSFKGRIDREKWVQQAKKLG